MPTLQQLEAQFFRYGKEIADETRGRTLPDGTKQYGGFEIDVLNPVESLADAQEIQFLCPLCFEKNSGPIGTHTVAVTFKDRGVPDNLGCHNKEGRATRWDVIGGTGITDLQLSPSILLESAECHWHGYVGNSGVPPGSAR